MIIDIMRRQIVQLGGAVCVCLFLLSAPVAQAAELMVAPMLIDREAEAREILTEQITLTNQTERKIEVYATVNEISVDSSGEIKEFVSPVMTDRTDTVTSWVEISRGRIEMNPGETVTVPLTIRIHPYAKPGDYHVFIGFVPGSKRFEAEATALAGDAEGVIVKVSLKDKTNELLRISGFLIDRFVASKENRTIDIEVENSGDVVTAPSGEIIFYNSRGEEMSSLPVNTEGVSVQPGEKKTIKTEIPFYNEYGRFKANLTLRYGEGQKAAVFDTTQFYMIPFHLMLVIIVVILVLSVVITFLIRRAFYDELHEDDDGNDLPLYVRNDRDHEPKDHDIHLPKSE